MPTWTYENKFKLLLSIITLHNPGALKWDEVAATMGTGYTVESVRQAYKKIKKDADTELSSTSGDAPSSPKKSPPRKKRKQRASSADEDDIDVKEEA